MTPHVFAGVASAAARRREIDRGAAAFVAACQGRLHLVEPDDTHPSAPEVLCETLRSLGGAFLLFGRYLAGRRDLVPAHYAVALDAMSDRAEPMESGELRAQLTSSLGRAADAFRQLDPDPFVSCVAWQQHRAVLPDGRRVVVRICRPALAADVEHLDRLDRFLDAMSSADAPADAFHAAILDFRDEFRDALDVRRELTALEQMASDADQLGRIAVPRIERAWSGGQVLTYEWINSRTLADECDALETPRTSRHQDLARLVVRAWLEQATFGRVFPSIVSRDTTICGERRVTFAAGPFHAVPPECQPALREYLLEAIVDPDRACAGFLQQLRTRPDRAGEAALRRCFRQAVPFRDDDWDDRGDGEDTLERHLWLHWRAATRAGFIPLPHLSAFYRGLTDVSRAARALAPHQDVLQDAVDDLRSAAATRDATSAMDPAELHRLAGVYLQLVAVLPERIDYVLRQASEGNARLNMAMPDAGRTPVRRTSLVLALVLLCLAVWMLGNDAATVATIGTKALVVALVIAAAALVVEART